MNRCEDQKSYDFGWQLGRNTRLSGVPLHGILINTKKIMRGDFAITKAVSVISMGMGSRSLEVREKAKPDFVRAVSQILGKAFMTMRGGVLLRNDRDDLIGAVGVSGDSSVNDELVAIEGITAAGFIADPGEN